MKSATCTTCKIRPAVYYRKESGEKLCLECLERSIVKQVKREINTWKMLGPHDVIGFLIPAEAILTSIPAFKIMSIIERKYATKLIAIKPSNLNGLKFETENIIEFQLPFKSSNLTEFLRFERTEAAKISKDHGVNKIVIPHTLEFETSYFLSNILKFNLEALGDLAPKLYSEKFNIVFVKPFRKVKSLELLIYGYFKGLLSSLYFRKSLTPFLLLKEIYEPLDYIISVSKEHFELVISTLKTAEFFFEKILEEYGFLNQCIFCGAKSESRICNVCSRLYCSNSNA